MKASSLSAMLKLALFMLLSSVFMIFIAPPNSAEFYISLLSAFLMLLLIAAIVFCVRVKSAKTNADNEEDTE